MWVCGTGTVHEEFAFVWNPAVLPLIASCTKSRPRHCYAQRAHGCWRVRRADGQVARRNVVATLSCAHAPPPPNSPMHSTEPTADRQRRRPRVTAAEASSSLPGHAHPPRARPRRHGSGPASAARIASTSSSPISARRSSEYAAAACPRPARTLSTDLGLRAGRLARWGGRGAGQRGRGRGRGTSSAAFLVRPTPYPSRCSAT